VIRRVFDLVVALALVGGGVVVAARVAEPSVRPVLYPPSASPSPAPPTTAPPSTTGAPATTAAPATTTSAPVMVATTTAPPTVSTAATTTTTIPVDEEAVLTAAYAWGPSEDAVLLQTVLGVEADGWYGPGTRQAHLAENEARGLSVVAVPSPPTTTAAPTTTAVPTTTAAPATTTTGPTTTAVPTTTVPPPSTTAGMFGGLGAKLVAQLLGQPCIADGDLSDCGPEVDALVKGLVK